MCIYCGTNKYRKIYENHFGKIPVDENNRTYDIHHIDGDHNNNHPDNLKAISLREHYDIHYSQKDWSACQLISLRLEISPEERSLISKMTQQKRVEDGTHPFLKNSPSRPISRGNRTYKKIGSNGSRPLCAECGIRPVAINYVKNGQNYYRKKCDHCSRGRKEGKPRWYKSGYRMKSKCDRCGYTSKYPQQFNVYHIDGNLNNCRYDNLKTVCANCQRLLHSLNLPWRQGDLVPDH